MKKYVCTVCGYIAEGTIPEQCPVCKAPASAFVEKTGNTYVTEHVVGIGKAEGVPQEIVDGLRANFEGECSEVGMYLAMARVAEREGYPEIAEAYKRYAYEEADHASRFAELRGEVVTLSLIHIYARDLSEDRRALPEVAGKDFVKNIFSFCRHFLPKPLASARQRCYSGTNILS